MGGAEPLRLIVNVKNFESFKLVVHIPLDKGPDIFLRRKKIRYMHPVNLFIYRVNYLNVGII